MSDILKSVHKTAEGLKKTGAIDKNTMRQFDALCSVTRSQSQSKRDTERAIARGKKRD